MRNILLALLLLPVFGASAQTIPAYNAAELIASTSSKDSVYIINFWATWCGPCVQELPEFNKLYHYYQGKPVRILLVSLDFKEDYPGKLTSFVQRKHLEPAVAWLADTDPNKFIPQIDNSWQGSIPATLVVQPGKGFKKFSEGMITEKKVRKMVDPLLR